MIKDLTNRTSCIILITVCLSIAVMNIVSMTDAAQTNMSLRTVENATSQPKCYDLVKTIGDTNQGHNLGYYYWYPC
jgi:hypothetical protein